jgi:protein-L-isoaspartate(D-aspartate) O-methyltransferase
LRCGRDFHVRWIAPAVFSHGDGALSDETADVALAVALAKNPGKGVSRLYRDDNRPEESCWLRTSGLCFAYE